MKQKPFTLRNPTLPGAANRSQGERIGLLLAAIGVVLVGTLLALQPWRSTTTESTAPWLVDFNYPEQNSIGNPSFSRSQSHAFLPNVPQVRTKLVLRVQSPAPLPARQLAIGYNQQNVANDTIGTEPRILQLLLPTSNEVATDGLVIDFNTPAATNPGDNRQLGLLFYAISTNSFGPPPITPWPWIVLVLGSALTIGIGIGVQRTQFYITSAALRSYAPTIGLIALCGTYATVLGYSSIVRYTIYRANTYDLGLYDQTLWLISRGYEPYNTGMGIHILGNHAAVLLFPLAAIYLIAPHVWTLLIVQSVVVALGAVPIYLIGRARGNPWLGLVVAAAYLLNPSTQNMTLFDFHPDTLAATALLFGLWAAEQRRWLVLFVCCAVVLGAKENFALTVAVFGLWLAIWHRERLHGGIIFVISMIWFFVTTQLILPTWSGQGHSIHLVERYGQYGDTIGVIVVTLISNPSILFATLISPENLSYVWQIIASFGLLCVFSPQYFVLAAPALILNIFSSSEPQHTFTYQYSALIIPIAAIATLQTVVMLRKRFQHNNVILAFGTACIFFGTFYSIHTNDLRFIELREDITKQSARIRYYDYMISLIPPDASISADMMVQTHLAHRKQAFLFPNPFTQMVFFNPQQMPYTAGVDYILYDPERATSLYMPSADKLAILRSLQERGLYTPLVHLDGAVLLQRSAAPLPASCFGAGWQAEGCRQ